jgi:hypothetical protein
MILYAYSLACRTAFLHSDDPQDSTFLARGNDYHRSNDGGRLSKERSVPLEKMFTVCMMKVDRPLL